MNWEAVTAVAEMVAGAGVIASLIYLAVQVRQNTRSIRAATYDSMARNSQAFLDPMIQDAQLARDFERAVENWKALDTESRTRVNYIFTQLFRMWENTYYQYRQQTLDPGLWSAWKGVILSYYHQPGIQEWWRGRAHAYSAEFRKLLESSAPPDRAIRTTRQLARDDSPAD